MKYAFKIILLAMSWIFIVSCDNKEEPIKINPVNIGFSTTSVSVAENSGESSINIVFGDEVPVDGTFKVEISGSAVYVDDYVTNPDGSTGSVTINVAVGDVSKALSFTPIDNNLLDGDRVVIFKISDVSEGIQLGSTSEFSVTITDDEKASEANFSVSSLTMAEGDAENEVIISFGTEAPADGSITIEIAGSAVYEDDYTTEPGGSSGSFTMDIKVGDASKSVKFLPVNNNIQNENKTVIFTLTDATGGIELGNDLVHTLTITDDDEAPLSIASLRTDFEANGSKDFTTGYIRGIMTSSKSNSYDASGRTIVMQDETGGIVIRFSAQNEAFDLGNELVIDLNGGTLEESNGLLRVNGVELTAADNLGEGVLPEAEVITPSELTSGDYESELVTVSDVAFHNVNGEKKFEGNMSGSLLNTKSDGFLSSFFKSGSMFEGVVIPAGVGNVTGISSVFFGSQGILLRDPNDFDLTEIATLDLATDGTDFGQVANGEISDTKTYTLSVSSGSLLQFALLGFTGTVGTDILELSYNGSGFGSTASVPVEDLEAGPVDILVRLLPDTGVNGVIENTLLIQSFGVASISQNLTVEEIGN